MTTPAIAPPNSLTTVPVEISKLKNSGTSRKPVPIGKNFPPPSKEGKFIVLNEGRSGEPQENRNETSMQPSENIKESLKVLGKNDLLTFDKLSASASLEALQEAWWTGLEDSALHV